jgi:hypothetical protein
MIAVENEAVPQVFVKDSAYCLELLKEYAEKLIQFRTSNT